MYSGVIGRIYRKGDIYICRLSNVSENVVELVHIGMLKKETISIEDFQNWIDCKHQMYVRQVGEATLPFPDEDC